MVCQLKSFGKVLGVASVRLSVAMAALCFGALHADADVTISSNTELQADTDYRGQGTVTIADGVTLELRGHKLYVDGLAGTGVCCNSNGYDVLEYVTLTAKDAAYGQKINLGFRPLSSDRLEMRFILPANIPSSRHYTLWCARGAPSAGSTYTCFAKGTGKDAENYIRYDYYNDNLKQSSYFSAGSIVHTLITDPAAGMRYFDDGKCNDFELKNFTVGSNLVIGSLTQEGGGHYGSFSVCGFKVTGSDGVVKHDFVPARRRSDGALGLLDRETRVFKGDSGNTGDPLEAGPTVGSAFADDVGEVHINVSGNDVVNFNNGVTLSGGLRVFKEGTGTMVLGTTKQNNSGGWEIAAGTVKPSVNPGKNQSFGALHTTVTVCTGATYDMNGQCDSRFYDFVLDGGTIANTGADIGDGWGCMGKITLTKDSALSVRSSFPLWDVVDLNGHTLDVDLSHKYLYLYGASSAFVNGTVNLHDGGWLKLCSVGGLRDMKTVDFVTDAALSLDSDVAVRNLTTAFQKGNVAGNSKINVYGVFTPASDYIQNFVLQDGATLNLAGRSDTYDLKSSLSGKTLGFAEGVTIEIALGERKLANEMKLVGWDAAIAPSSSVTFRLPDEVGDDYMLDRRSDGLYVTAAVKTATWTGEADTDCTNSANWICYDANGQQVDGARPGSATAVTLSGAVQIDIPANSTFSCASFTCDNASLKGDCDWSGLGQALGGSIDLAGHKLTVSSLTGDATITDSHGYDVLEYVALTARDASNGQKIHLDCTPLASDRLEMRFILPANIPNGRHYALWCARGAKSAGSTYTCFAKGTGSDAQNYLRYDYYSDNIKQSANFSAGNIVHTVVTDPAAGMRYFDDGKCNDFESKNFTVGSSIVIGTAHLALAPDSCGHYGSFSVCGFTVTGSDGALKHDFVPARRRSDGTLGLLDRKTGDFKLNSGNTDDPLGAGPVVGGAFADGAGELHIDVADGQTTEIAAVVVSGAVRVVKEGAGTLMSGTTKQYNTGGWEIVAGTVKPSGNPGKNQSFGALHTTVTVCTGATYDMNGQCDSRFYDFVLDGGTIANTGADINWGYGCMGKITLTKDSALSVKSSFPLWDVVDLNGHTLDVDLSHKYLYLYGASTTFVNGTVNLHDGGWLQTCSVSGGSRDMKTVDFVIDAALYLDSGMAVRNLTAAFQKANAVGVGKINVYGVFTPASDYIHNFVLQDGATLNLADRSDAYDLKSSLTGETLGFAGGVPTVRVALGDRKVHGGERVVAWAAGSTPNVKFRPAAGAKYGLSVKDDGLYVEKGFTLVIR